MAEKEVLDIFNLTAVHDEAVLKQVYGDRQVSDMSEDERLRCWLACLPDNISKLLDLALCQERPFLPPDVTPEMMASANDNIPSMNHIEIICRCIAVAVAGNSLTTAAALLYMVDRAVYRFGDSRALLVVVDMVLEQDPRTPVAPQVILRKARVMKDDGDLHGSIRVLDAVISKESVWDYKSEDQYNNVKAVCVQVKGQILHNLGLWKEAIEPLVESVQGFGSIHDDKGTSSSLGLLTKCLKKLTVTDFMEVKQKFPSVFSQSHPCYEAYVQGLEAVRYIADLGQTLYIAKHQLVAEESLLMYALQQPPSLRGFQWFQTIVTDIKQTLTTHKSINNLKSVETFFEFIRAIFLIHLTLYFSPVPQDRSLSKYLEQISMELYRHLCASQSRRHLVTNLNHTENSVSFMNATLGILGLPSLGGGADDLSVEAEVGSASESSQSTDKKIVQSADVKEPQTEKAGTVPVVLSSRSAVSKANTSTFPGAPVTHHSSSSSEVLLRKYVGLPVDASSFSVSYSSSSSSEGSSGREEKSDTPDSDLVNLSVASISETAERLDKLHLNSSSEFVDSFGSVVISSVPTPSDQATDKKQSKSASTSSAERSSSLSEGSSSEPSQSFSGLSSSSNSSSDKPSAKLSSSDSSSFVDLSATTQDDYSWCHVTEEIGELSPLVDLSCSTVNSSFESLNFGESVKTDSPVEYLEHWQPPSVDESITVNKALYLTYNPVTGDWVSQSTLVHVGQEVDLGTNRKGNCRDVFHVFFLHQDEPLGRYVCKRYRQQRAARYYQQDVVCQMMAGYYVTRFNQALQHHHSNIQVQFLPAAHLQLLTPSGHLDDWVNVEPYLHGSFIKLTNNLSFSKKDHGGEELATAFTHFSYCESRGVLMIVDIQGWYPKDGKGIIYLTDPQFHTRGVKRFSPADQQEKGMKLFWSRVHPKCNSICLALGLERPE